MTNKQQRQMTAAKTGIDLITVAVVYFLSVNLWLWKQGTLDTNLAGNLYMPLVYAMVTIAVFKMVGLYSITRISSIRKECATIVKAQVLVFFVFAAIFFIFKITEFSRGALALGCGLSAVAMVLQRIAMRGFLARYRKRGFHAKRVVVVGSGDLAMRYYETIMRHPEYGFVCVGYVSDKAAAPIGKHLGDFLRLEKILSDISIDEVVIALEQSELPYLDEVVSACEKNGTKLQIVPFYNDYMPATPSFELVGNIKLVNMRNVPLSEPANRAIKRAMDICCALILILLTSPIMIFVAIGIKFTSKGPVIFRQERVGKDKKIFTMYKFRSMRITGTEQTGWSSDQDPRKTKFGSFIRKVSLDEFPQFFNVLFGTMSLIGPRPEVPYHVENFKETIPLYMVKHQVKPGITGWAQVNGLRGDTSIEERVKHDIWYIEHWSIWLDVAIVFKTIFGGMINSEAIRK